MDAASTQSTLSIPTFYVANPSNYTTLSNGAIAGIAVGCIAFVAIIAAAICFTCLRKRRPRRPQAVEKGTGSGSGVPMWKKFSHGIHSAVEAPTSYNRSQDRSQRRSHNDPLDSGKKELPVAPKHPAVRHNKNRVAEVPGESRRYELPANDGLVPGGRSGLGNTTTVSAEPAAIVRAMRNAWNQSPTSPVPPLERTH